MCTATQKDLVAVLLKPLGETERSRAELKSALCQLTYGQLSLLALAIDEIKHRRCDSVLRLSETHLEGPPLATFGNIGAVIEHLEARLRAKGVLLDVEG